MSKKEQFEQLTWADIVDWAGAAVASRGKNYHRGGKVQKLALTPGGAVVAWVQGTEKYATLVDIGDDELASDCTCPYDGTCKHAVAVALEYLEDLEKDTEVPCISQGDARLGLLGNPDEAMTHEEQDEEAGEAPDRPLPGGVSKRMHSYLEQQSREQLVALVEDLARRHPVVAQSLEDRADLAKGAVARMTAEVRKEIAVVSAEPGWRHHWDGEGYTPDYSGVRDRLQALLEAGHADEVVALGKELLEAGIDQVEMSDDEGETASEISACMNVVFQALSRSSLPPAEQMMWAVQADLQDDYDLCSGASVFWDQQHAPADWNVVADTLTHLLEEQKPAKGEDAHSRDYHRDQLTGWLITALEGAGRKEEIIPLCEREAKKTGSYVRLVNHLIEAGRNDDAERWIREGVRATRKELPGIAQQLRTLMREMREKERDWPQVAAFRAADFFAGPSLNSFQELQKAAEQAGVWPEVRAAAMLYLETGRSPRDAGKARVKGLSSWPLPETGLPEDVRAGRSDFPLTDVLIDIAMAEKRPDEVLRWYDRKKPGPAGDYFQPWSREDKVAGAIAGAYPDRAVAIWKKLAESQIAETKPRAYEVASGFLGNIRRTLKKLGREQEWETYLAQLRQANIRKRRLVEILDGFGKRAVLDRDQGAPPPEPRTKRLL